MADKKKAPEPSGDAPLLWSTIGFIFLLFLLGSVLGNVSILDKSTGTVRGLDAAVPAGDIQLGERIVNRLGVLVRQVPGGAVIGEQAKRAIGTIAEGPVAKFGKEWVRIDYEKDPDGWVDAADVTTNVGWFQAANIFPILFDIFRPIGIVLTLILLVLLVLVLMKRHKVAQFEAKKKETEQAFIQARMPKEQVITKADGPINLPGVPQNLPTGLPEGLVFEQQVADQTGPKNERWERVERLMNSTTASDWRQAVIEADIILDEMLTRMGYEGTSIGDRLKQIEQSDFITLNKAWEAHKVRNHLAHRGGDYVFPKNEAERVVGLYRQVFQEFYYI
ncbi:MAG: hypothetical protein RL150_466 [Candidatus Parcubacteria bacterium]|jgi:hypothetical protein